jgi:hypothetical protein
MITIIHGDDIVSSRNFYYELKQRLPNVVYINGENIIYNDFFQATQNESLFGNEHIFIENFFSKNKSEDFKKIIEYINRNKNLNIVFFENTKLSKNSLSLIKNAELKLFSIPEKMFFFLDNLKPGNSKTLLKLFNDLKKQASDEFIYFMIVRQFRLLLAVSGFDKTTIDEVKKLALWQTGKLKAQAKLFGIEKLKLIYSKLYEIDSAQKSGKLATTLTQAIDFLLADL